MRTLACNVRCPSVEYTSTGADWDRSAPVNPLSRLFCSDCWNRIRNTSSPIATISSPKRTLARRISFRARNISHTVRSEP